VFWAGAALLAAPSAAAAALLAAALAAPIPVENTEDELEPFFICGGAGTVKLEL